MQINEKKQLMSNIISNKFAILKPVNVLGNELLRTSQVFYVWPTLNKPEKKTTLNKVNKKKTKKNKPYGLKFVTQLLFLNRAYEYEASK